MVSDGVAQAYVLYITRSGNAWRTAIQAIVTIESSFQDDNESIVFT